MRLGAWKFPITYAPVTRILEWYLQDSWRVAPRLTLDLGMRFTAGLPQLPAGNNASTFVPSLWDRSKAPALYLPGRDAQGNRAAIDPTCPTCLPKPQVFIGLLVPDSGDVLNGIVKSGTPGYPEGLVDYKGVLPAPRLGFAWDVAGDHRTALRGGFGVNYSPRNGAGILGDATSNPPMVFNPIQYYGNTATFLQVGAKFLPENQDPTRPGSALSDNFLRPYRGYAGIPFLTFEGTSTYHSLQAHVTRRLSRGLQFGAAYTLSRALDYTEGEQGAVAVSVPPRVWNYGLAGYDRTHSLALNYLISVPRARWFGNHAVTKAIFDGWQLAGTSRFVSGAPLRWGQTTSTGNSNSSLGTGNLTPGVDLTGGGEGWRPVVIGQPDLPRGQRTFSQWFNTAAFARPEPGSRGNAGPVVARGPGINNWNMSLFKNVKAGGRANVQVRAEAYNVFNHTQFSMVDTTPRFDAQGNQVSGTFGQVTATRDPRIMQFALRVSF